MTCVLYKVVTFEDCAEAAGELANEIDGAKVRLQERGFEL